MAQRVLRPGRIAAQLHSLPRKHYLPWKLRVFPVCSSTEVELERLMITGASPPLAVLSVQQQFGKGQQGRIWCSPPGGVWISAAMPWPTKAQVNASFALAVAVGIAHQLEKMKLAPKIKWPNDLMVDGLKLVGILPRFRWRGGDVLYARVGIGINGTNHVPAGAINLSQLLGRRNHLIAQPYRLAARILIGLEWAAAAACEPELVRKEAESRLFKQALIRHEDTNWKICGLNIDGSLRIKSENRGEVSINRMFF